jgi:hypothetical protein
MSFRSSVSAFIVALTALCAPSIGASAHDAGLTATHEGRRMDPSAVGRFHCHDIDHPRLRCFSSPRRRDADAARRIRRLSADPRRATRADAYVRLYEHQQFQGASVLLSVAYPDLGVIGWSDRVTSFKSVNWGSGTFFRHIQMDGATYPFCCNSAVANVGGAYNDTFSSVSGSA